MKQIRKSTVVMLSIATAGMIIVACSKGGDTPTTPTPPAGNACASKNIVVTASATNVAGCNGGTVTASATGSTNFTFSIDGGSFQSTGTFNNVNPGDHTIVAKDGEGCTKSATVNVATTASGPLFAAVKAVIVANCNSCHTGAAAQGGQNLGTDCNIVNAAARIKARAVDGNPSFMPQGGQLNSTDKQKITNWLAAGGKYSD